MGLHLTDTKALNSTAIGFGDSIVADMSAGTGNYRTYQSIGFLAQALPMTGFYFYLPVGFNQAVGGQNTDQMLARITDALKLKPSVVIIESGTNDNWGVTDTIGNWKKFHKLFRGIGAKVVQLTILPKFSPATLTTEQEAIRQAENAWLLSQDSSDIIVINAESTMNNASLFRDGVHPNTFGAYTLAKLVAAKLNKLKGSNLTAGDLLAPDNSANSNPFMLGTGGQKQGTATGTVADNYIVRNAEAGGSTVVGSIVIDSDGNNGQKIVVSGNYTGSSNPYTVLSIYSAGLTFTSSDQVEMVVEFEVQGTLTNIKNLKGHATLYDAGSAVVWDVDTMTNTLEDSCPYEPGVYTMRTPVGVPSATPVASNLYFYITQNNSGSSLPVGATVVVRKMFLRKV